MEAGGTMEHGAGGKGAVGATDAGGDRGSGHGGR